MNDSIPVFHRRILNSKLASLQVAEDLQNHLVYDHSYTDNINLCITVLNLILSDLCLLQTKYEKQWIIII